MKKFTLLSLVLASLSFAYASDTTDESSQMQRPQQMSAEQAIAKMDTDGDGMLSEDEVKGPLKKDFSKIDTDGDGYITEDELQNAPKPQRGGGQGQRPPRPDDSSDQ